MTQPDRKMLRRKEAARYLSERGFPVTARTLAKLASNKNAGGGPSFYRWRWNSVGYLPEDLDKWLERELRRVE